MAQWMVPALCGLVVLGCCRAEGAGGRTRELANLVWAWSGEFEEAVRWSKERGCTAVRVHMPWYRLEPEEGCFDFSWADGRVGRVVEAGLSVMVTVDCGRGRPAWFSGDELFARTEDGELYRYPQTGWYGEDGARARDLLFPSVAHAEVRSAVARVMGALARHYEEAHPGAVLLYYPVLSHPQETELLAYADEGWTMIDYSEAAQSGFRRWVRGRHGRLGALSSAWGREVAGWDDVRLEDAPAWDFFSYRAEMLGGFIDEYAAAVRGAGGSPAAQFGCVWDGLAYNRGTLDAHRLGRELDWVIVDDGPAGFFDNRFSMSYLRGARCGGAFVNEIDGPWHPAASTEGFGRQGVVSLDEGADALICANWAVKHLKDRETWPFWEDLAARVRVPAERVRARRALFVSLAEVYERFGEGDVYALAGEAFHGLLGQTDGPVDVITDTALCEHPDWMAGYTDGVWVGAFNVRLSEAALDALQELTVPVFVESDDVGTLDEYGRARETVNVAPCCTVEPARTREFGAVFWTWSREFEDEVVWAKKRGCTVVRVHAPWYLLEPEEGVHDFSFADGRVDYVVEQGLRAMLTVDCGYGRPAWMVGDELFCRLGDGSLYVYNAGPPYRDDDGRAKDGYFPSVAHPRVVRMVSSLLEAAAAHYGARHPGKVLLYYPVLSQIQETELIAETTERLEIVDYSDAAQAMFREWMVGRHASLDSVAAAWGTPASSWEGLRLQDAPDYDLFAFRTEMLGRFIDAYAAGVRRGGGSPAAQFGCIWDDLAYWRGTLDCARLGAKLDWVIVDDGPSGYFDNRFSMSYLRGVRCGGRFANEIDGPSHPAASDGAYAKQGLITLEEGADAVMCANWRVEHMSDTAAWTFWERIADVAGRRASPVRARRALFVSLAEVYGRFGEGDVYELAGGAFNELAREGYGPVDIVTDTVLCGRPDWMAGYTDGVWVGSFNRRMTGAVLGALRGLPVPVFMESDGVGVEDEYGRPR